MKTINRNILAVLVMTMLSVQPALAEEADHLNCNSDAMVMAGKMGMVDEEALQAHIDKVNEQMKRVSRASKFHVNQKLKLKLHLLNMQDAMEKLHDQMYLDGCNEARHGASIETRVEVLEKHMNMKKMM